MKNLHHKIREYIKDLNKKESFKVLTTATEILLELQEDDID